MIFKQRSAYHMVSDCGGYTICKSRTERQLAYHSWAGKTDWNIGKAAEHIGGPYLTPGEAEKRCQEHKEQQRAVK